MKIELGKEEIESAIKSYLDVWFPAIEVIHIDIVRTKKTEDIKYIVNIKEKGE